MHNQEMILIIAGGLLLMLAAVLLVRLYQYKRQLRSFIKRINERKSANMNQPVTVEYFDKDILALADALNEYTDMVKKQMLNLEQDRRQLKNVIAGISHDFRTPLTAAKGYMQMIDKNGVLDERNQEYLAIAMDKTEYLKTLSDAFFEVSAIEANTEQVIMEPVHMTNFLSEQIMSQYDWIKESGLDAVFHVPEQDIVVISNMQFLGRIFENLFSNARKYAVSKLSLTMKVEEKRVMISMKNDMMHSDDFDAQRVFEAFYREASRHSEGTGLGLYVVKCLADKLGHKVWAESDGEMFEIYIECEREKNS